MPKLRLENHPIQKKFRLLSLLLTKSCNLKCSYCYEKNGIVDNTFMDFEIAKEAINRYMFIEDEFEEVIIDFFGGEPLLAFPLMKKIVEWTTSRKWPKDYRFSLGTNGTLLTNDIKNWLKKYKECLAVSFSINGNKISHDLTRDNSYDLLYPHIPFFMENWPGQPAKMTICAETIPYVAASVIELEEMGLFFTANIAFEDFWGNAGQKENLLDIYNEQLMLLVDYYAEHPDLVPVYRILDAFPLYLGIQDTGQSQDDCTRFCGAGHEMVLIDVDGQTYPCHRFIPWVTGKPAPKIKTNIQRYWKPEVCTHCKIVDSCPTCAGYNWEENNETGIRTIYHCEANKLEVLASAKLIALKLKKQQIPELESMNLEKRKKLKKRIEVLWELIENGI